ncbi:type I restriction enzyme HsdR N-terminal domain-containing protein [Coraliomargarita sinensis]|nr:type I restriction enzyme HsdR N-terminal domain-containing protein [Coraliomargarita sinensis]
MNVTAAAKLLSEQADLDLQWPETLPQAIYAINVPDVPSGDPLELGEDFHACLEAHLGGRWVSKDHYYSCSAVAEILRDLGLETKNFSTEVPVKRGHLVGKADIVAQDTEKKPWVVEIKTTQGRYALAPSTAEFCQLALYAGLMDKPDANLACIRINFKIGKVSVFIAQEKTAVLKIMNSVTPNFIEAA